MYHFEGDNTTEIGNAIYQSLAEIGIITGSRNGEVICFDKPVSVTYLKPWKRCNFTVGRDANPVFHHMESIWMLSGRRDVYFPSIFNSNIGNYSDDGKTFNAAYGYRMRHHFGYDQFKEVCKHLIEDPGSRQAVIQLWDPADLNKDTKDKACNMSMVFSIKDSENYDGFLNMTIFNRSNDAIWGGVTGANPVHFSYIMQAVFERLVKVHEKLQWGTMTFISNNLHVYTQMYPHWKRIEYSPAIYPVAHDEPWIGSLDELNEFCEEALFLEPIIQEDGRHEFNSDLLNRTTIPMFNYWIARKYHNDEAAAQDWLDEIQEPDWKLMVSHWDRARKRQ